MPDKALLLTRLAECHLQRTPLFGHRRTDAAPRRDDLGLVMALCTTVGTFLAVLSIL